jgi:hypothetical protein
MKNQKVTFQYPNGDIDETFTRSVTDVTRDEYGNETGTAKINGSEYIVTRDAGKQNWFTSIKNWLVGK